MGIPQIQDDTHTAVRTWVVFARRWSQMKKRLWIASFMSRACEPVGFVREGAGGEGVSKRRPRSLKYESQQFSAHHNHI
jgi:hypothetical protein